MPALLLGLALQANDDPAARQVLGDAVLESGWFDPRVMQVMWFRRARRRKDRIQFMKLAAKPTGSWARAIAAVLLFGDWQQEMWPMAFRAIHITSTIEVLRSLYTKSTVSVALHRTLPTIGLIPKR